MEPRAGTVHPAKLALGLRALAMARGLAALFVLRDGGGGLRQVATGDLARYLV